MKAEGKSLSDRKYVAFCRKYVTTSANAISRKVHKGVLCRKNILDVKHPQRTKVS